MRVKHDSGTIVDVPDKKARQLTGTGSWHYVDEAPEPPVGDSKTVLKGNDTPEPVETVTEDAGGPEEVTPTVESVPEEKPGPSIPEIRAWALENNRTDVKPKGKLAKTVIDAYLEAHKE
jgi:hypothetical protein